MRKVALMLLSLFLFLQPARGAGTCDFLNPFTDVCWECLFPIKIMGITVIPGGSGPDYTKVSQPICYCNTPFPRLGLTFEMWNPARVAETVFGKWKFPAICLDMSDLELSGGETTSTSTSQNQPKYSWQVHWYFYPLLSIIGIMQDVACLQATPAIDIGYITEVDPMWNNEDLANSIFPETYLLANLPAELACIPERVLTSVNQFGLNPLFWCAGNWGTTYPFVKDMDAADKPISSGLAVAKLNAELHRLLISLDYDLCGTPKPAPLFPKKLYKYQLVKPININKCIPVGADGIWWEWNAEPFAKDTYHVWVIWKKTACCLL